MNRQHPTPALVARYNELRRRYQVEYAAALAQAQGHAADLMAVILADDGIKPHTARTEALRQCHGLGRPVLPSAQALHAVSIQLYRGRGHGTASGSEAGG